jgi:polysaccharide export outer membrane protein
VYRRTRRQLGRSYELQIGDIVRVESLTAGQGTASRQRGDSPQPSDDTITRELIIQPDGTITLPLIGQIRAAARSVGSLRDELEEKYKKYFRVPSITVTPVQVDTRLVDLLEAVDARAGVGGLQFEVIVTPAGGIMLPGLGQVYVQGLTLEETKWEVDARYDATIPGVEVTPVVTKRAPRFVYVLGEVETPGQFELQGPTSVIQAIALAGGWQVGANLRQVVVFRRGDDWRMMATMVDVRGALYARRPVPADDVWLSDSDVVLVPKTQIEVFDEFLEQYIIRGLYGVVPIEKIWGVNFASTTSLIAP